MASWRPHAACRVCGSLDLSRYLDLRLQAPANALRQRGETPSEKFPLSIQWCANCNLSQLEQVVDPKILYTNYPFRAGASQQWREHCDSLVDAVTGEAGVDCGEDGLAVAYGFWLDIGANDGVLLQSAGARGWRVLGVDPGGVDGRIPVLQEYWGREILPGLQKFHGRPNIITATNVFGHVDDPREFLGACAEILHPRGQVIIEAPHIIPLLDRVAFDTIYHEHLSYWSLQPLEILAEWTGLRVVHCQWFHELHGGTMRYTLVPRRHHRKHDNSVTGLRILENGLSQRGLTPYREFALKAERQIDAFRDAVKSARGVVAGYGASAKGSVRIQAAQLTANDIRFIVDDATSKQGYLSPGTDIPIRGPGALGDADVLILLSWNNAKDLEAKAKRHGFRGTFLNPVTLAEAA